MSSLDLQARLQRALTLVQSASYGEAARACREIIESHPLEPEAWHMLAYALLSQGAWDSAAEAAERATDLQPRAAPYWLTRGKVAAAQRRDADAQKHFERAVALHAGFAEAQYHLARMLHRQHRIAEAIAAYRAAARGAPDVAEIHWQLADALVTGSDVEGGIAAYERAFTLDPQGRLDRRWCLQCMARLPIERLSPFWQAEIERFFERTDVDKTPCAGLAIKALRSRHDFPRLLNLLASRNDGVHTEALTALGDPLLHALLRDCLMPDTDLEHFLTQARRAVLLDPRSRATVPLAFLAALALQCFLNEYVYAEDAAERAAADALRVAIEKEIPARTETPQTTIRSVLVLGSYRTLEPVAGADAALSRVKDEASIRLICERAIEDVRAERALRTTFRALAPIEDDVSQAVRGMYEENPYPRWTVHDRDPPLPMSQWLAGNLPSLAAAATADAPVVLVAGCGTGQDANWIAANIADSKVLAIDLSLSSLAYAARMARALPLTNIDFVHGDILALDRLDEQFDLIVSTGVVHHMRDAQAGLGVLARRLRPGGLMKLGLYSARARAGVNAARAQIAKLRLSPTAAGIRDMRQRIFAAPPESDVKAVAQWDDFYSLSMCRDLLFHVQEHQFGLPEIGRMLDACGLSFVGLADLPLETADAYRRMFPDDREARNLSNWDRYEELHPRTFRGMYLFWCRLTAA